MSGVLDFILRAIGALTLAVIAAVGVAWIVLDIQHRRRGLHRPAPSRRPDATNQRIYVGKWPEQ